MKIRPPVPFLAAAPAGPRPCKLPYQFNPVCEFMRLVIKDTKEDCGKYCAAYVVARIRAHNAKNTDRPFVLGLPTGSSPIPVYEALVAMHKNGDVSFKNVVTFNMGTVL
jgi:glucosamine-6-phosphate deaminase